LPSVQASDNPKEAGTLCREGRQDRRATDIEPSLLVQDPLLSEWKIIHSFCERVVRLIPSPPRIVSSSVVYEPGNTVKTGGS
jgi:hypothetical protein